MSNYLAFAAVTTTLGQIVGEALQAVPKLSASPEVRLARPDNKDTQFVGAYVYLYRVSPNATWRNEDLPTRRGDGTLIQRPQTAFDLHYLLTFYGNDAQLEPQRLLGSTVSALHAQPVLTRDKIRQVLSTYGPDSYLTASDLDNQISLVKFTPDTLNFEELSKLWTTFLQAPHALSVMYQGSAVLIEADLPIQRALPTLRANTTTVPGQIPVITQTIPSVIEYRENAPILIRGENLRANQAMAQFGTILAPVQQAAGGNLTTFLPAGVFAGTNRLQLVYEDSQPSIVSNEVLLAVQPRIIGEVEHITMSDPRNSDTIDVIRLNVLPEIAPYQRIYLLLNEIQSAESVGGSSEAYSFSSLLRFVLDPRYQISLNSGGFTQDLQNAFSSAQFRLSSTATITARSEDGPWIIDDTMRGQTYVVHKVLDKLAVYFGLGSDDPAADIANQLAFTIMNVASGDYLVRVLVERQQYAESRLSTGALLFTLALKRAAPLDTGSVPQSLQKAFRDNSVALSRNVTVSPETPGSRWYIADADQGKAYLVRKRDDILSVFDIDAQDAPFIEPMVTIP